MSRSTEAGSARIVVLALISFLLGVAVTAFWFHHAAPSAPATVAQTTAPPPAPESVGIPAPAPAPTATPQSATPEAVDPAVIEQVKKAVPNYASVSLEEAEQILRQAALKAFADATSETDAQMKTAQQQLQNAQSNGSEADQQAAMKHVQDTQAAATEKLKQIAANLQAQISALKSLKNAL
ncbi:MAG TPA: hypothetical protein VGY56_00200 [Verrucomicrobiae bacterium]|nr:hypothetical protein [Verrucomicrobiae bacterium]